ncbi:MAG: FAD-dependent oxidoreductase, partial [Chitinivibrionales bacterium]|nr:FAD-dependent oxidoreductase [Chitinivibrionales bacterium]
LEKAEFARYGSIHRNTYVESPRLLTSQLSLRSDDQIFIAGQLCGSEGYTESIMTGHFAARVVASRIQNRSFQFPPASTACGALLAHVTGGGAQWQEQGLFSPSNIHFGLFEPLGQPQKRRKYGRGEKKAMLCQRALAHFQQWLDQT